jgi:hypothetical protein
MKSKLRLWLTLITAALLVAAVAGVSVVLLIRARILQTEEAFSSLEELTGRYSMMLRNNYENYLSVAKTPANIMDSHGINEMITGADQINVAVIRVNEISSNNRDSINVLVKELSCFKAENAEKGGNRAAA